MARLVYLKENIKYYYQKYAQFADPAVKFLFSFVALLLFQMMFPYNSALNKPLLFVLVSAVQAFLPMSMLYYTASILVMLNLWKVSMEMLIVFFFLFLICLLSFVRVDSRYAFIIILTPILFHLKLEYFIPVLLGMTVGFNGILPELGGIFIYYFSLYTQDAIALLTTSSESEMGIGMSRVMNLIMIDKTLLVVLVTFCLVTFISTLLYQLFHERAWSFAIIIGNVAMVLLLLSGRLIFELNYSIVRVFLESVLAMGLAVVVQFFEGIGDFSRMEKVSFEDDEYIYYVKAVPKIKVSQSEHNVTNIKPEGEEDSFDMPEADSEQDKNRIDIKDEGPEM